MRPDNNKDHVIRRILPWVSLLGVTILAVWLYLPLLTAPAEKPQTMHDTASEEQARETIHPPVAVQPPEKPAITSAAQKPAGYKPAVATNPPTQTAAATPGAVDNQDGEIGETASDLANKPGEFVKHVFTQKRSTNLWKSLKHSDINPALLEQLLPLQRRLNDKSILSVDILYSDYVKNGESNPRNSKVLAVHMRRQKGDWLFYAKEDDGKMQYYDIDGNAPELSMDRLPFQYSRISSPFNPHRRHPITGRIRPHEGTDMKGAYGTPIHTTGDGIVTFADWQSGYGRLIIIDHGNGYETRYAHLAAINVRPGQRVKRGNTIGKLGNSGVSTGAHLHYEVRVNDIPRDPMQVKLPSSRPLRQTDMESWRYYASEYSDTIDRLRKK